MVGKCDVWRKTEGVVYEEGTWTVAFDKNRAFRKQNGERRGRQGKDWMEDMKYHDG